MFPPPSDPVPVTQPRGRREAADPEHGRGPTSAFVAGATGYTGRAVVRRLVEAGVETFAHVRPDSPRLEEWRERFGALGARVDVTPWTGDGMERTVGTLAPRLVFALLGTTRKRRRRAGNEDQDETYTSVDYGLTTLLLGATRRAAPGARFVYLSAMGTGPDARGAYLRARWQAERDIAESGVEHVIARPSFITGPDREESRPIERASAVAVDAALTVAGALGARRLRDRYTSMGAGELADGLVRLALDPDAGGVYEADALRRPRR